MLWEITGLWVAMWLFLVLKFKYASLLSKAWLLAVLLTAVLIKSWKNQK